MAEMDRALRDRGCVTLTASLETQGEVGNGAFAHAFPQEPEHQLKAQVGARWPGFEFWPFYLRAVCACRQVTSSLGLSFPYL